MRYDHELRVNSICPLCDFSLVLLITHVKVWRKQLVRLHGLNFCHMESREVFEVMNRKSMLQREKSEGRRGLMRVGKVEELLEDWKP